MQIPKQVVIQGEWFANVLMTARNFSQVRRASSSLIVSQRRRILGFIEFSKTDDRTRNFKPEMSNATYRDDENLESGRGDVDVLDGEICTRSQSYRQHHLPYQMKAQRRGHIGMRTRPGTQTDHPGKARTARGEESQRKAST